ncbi:MAG: cytochrome b N-terminal domain-containing protein [Rhizobiales bacterium]|nr:cytochrome b N-terminal domain-containing protein [Hyphomicrobiales bacterium]NRB14093.1 cytochrome b N-terminal domain-containing protein [Hyphomicrobiales bacterium]
MSGHATYVPKSDAGKWLEKRLPIISLMHSAAVSMPNPRNLNYWWVFGGIAMFMLIVQIVTGIVLAMHYTPQADMAFNSVEHIMRDVNWGWLLRYTHANGASMFFIAVYIHILRGMYYGSYKAPREVLWLLGMLIYFLMMATGFMGYVLPWGQMSFWGATVITNFFEVVPFIGDDIRILLWGGFAVDNPTLNRFFSLHYLLPFVIVAVVVLHIWALHVPGSNNPLGVEAKTKQDTLSFHPYFTMKDLYGIVLFAIILFYFVFFNPNFMGHPDNYIPANPLVTPAHIVPEWYYLPFYAILRAIPDKAMGVAGMFGAILIMFVVPWLDTSKVRSAKFRPAYRIFFWIFVFNGLLLGYFGQVSTTDNFLGIDGITNLIVSRFSTFYYFAFFVVVLPLLGLIEKTKPLPNSISEAVLGEEGAAEEAADLAAVDAKA